MSLRGVRRDSAGRHAKTRNAGMHKRGRQKNKAGKRGTQKRETQNDPPNGRLGWDLKLQLKGGIFVKRGKVKTFTVPWELKIQRKYWILVKREKWQRPPFPGN